jgi:hypothetical protein
MIYIECNPDLSLIKSLVNIRKRDIIHSFKGKGEICNLLRNISDTTAMIDEDPFKPQPPYIKETIIEKDLTNEGIILRLHQKTKNHLIVICPDLEGWIIKACQEAQIDIGKYGLPHDARKLHGEINLILDKYERLLDDLKKSSTRMKTLRLYLEKYR